MILTDKIRGSFSRIFDEAKPANDAALRKRALSATQVQNMKQILADLDVLDGKRNDYRFAGRRLEVLTWLHATRVGKKFEDLDDATRIGIERAAVEGDQRAILHQDAFLAELTGPLAERAKAAVMDAHRSLLPHLRDEFEKVKAILDPVFCAYDCGGEVETVGPLRRLARAIDDSERCAAGQFIFGHDHIRGEFATWLA